MRTDAFVTESHGTEAHNELKTPCKCGCKCDKTKWEASVSASPQFIHELDEEVKVLLEKAKQVQRNGRPRYFGRATRLTAGPYRTFHLSVVDLYLLQTRLRLSISLVSKVWSEFSKQVTFPLNQDPIPLPLIGHQPSSQHT